MKINNIYILLLSIFIFSCNNKEKKSIIDYFKNEKIINLSGKTLELINKDEIYNPLELLKYDSLLILGNINSPSMFTLINLKEKQILKHFGIEGNGPGEFLGCIQLDRAYSPNSINVPDIPTRRMYQFSMDSIIFCDNPIPYDLFSSINSKEKIKECFRLLQLDDSMYLVAPGMNGARFALFNKSTGKLSQMGTYPKNEEEQTTKKTPIAS